MMAYNFFRNYHDAAMYAKGNGGIVKLLVTQDGIVTREGLKFNKAGYDLQFIHIFRFVVVDKIK